MRTIAIASHKGGVGKTTLAINLSAAFAKLGKRALVVDMDPQGHCAVGVALPEDRIEYSILDCLQSQGTSAAVDLSQITWQVAPDYDLAPASPALSQLEERAKGTIAETTLLTQVLNATTRTYDVCVIDCPPHPGTLMRNALKAADEIVIPVETGYYALHDLPGQIEAFEAIAREGGRQVRIHVVPNQYDVRTKLAREILAELRQRFASVITNAVINFNTKLKEGACYGQPITEFAPGSSGAHDFGALARELLHERTASAERTPSVDAIAARLAADSDRLLATSTPLITAETRRDTTTKRADVAGDQRKTDQKIAAAYGAGETSEGVVFRTLRPEAQHVQLAGDFNDWMPHATPMRRTGQDGVFETRLNLPQGRYRYRLVVDGRWARDEDNPHVESNEYGEINSVVEVG